MKKWILIGITALFLAGCGGEKEAERAPTGHIGADCAVSRQMAAKMIALAFYSNAELDKLETELPFSDVEGADWAYPYIRGCVAQGFFAGSEEGTFRPQDDMTLWEAQALMDRLAPDYDSRIVLTEENKNMAVSYELWVQLLETALKSRRGEDSVYSYGLQKEDAVLLSADGLCDTGRFTAAGVDLRPYEYSRITFLEKEGEILALLTVEAQSPVVQNIYCRREKNQLILETGEGAAEIPYAGKCDDGIYSVKLENGRITELTPVASLGRQTVKWVDAKGIYLAEKGALSWAENARIYDVRGEVMTGKYADLICGTDTAEYFEQDGKICAAVLREDAILKNIRVFLKGKVQEKVTLSAENGFALSHKDAEKKFPAGTKATLTADLPWFDHGILTAQADSPIQVDFADGTSCRYEGILELERRDGGFTIVNELPVERYLQGVVPHEMPTSFGQTALEAQTITARSYAYHQFYGNTYCEFGAHVADTVASQVYLGYTEDRAAAAAVEATKGLCAVADGKVAQTYFYSTSCGFGAGSEEVWSADGSFRGTGKPYLKAQTYGNFDTPKTEEEWLGFWQDWDRNGNGLDMDSPWYRWKVYFSRRQISEILGRKLSEISQNNKQVVLLQQDEEKEFLLYKSQEMGLLTGMEVTRRGAGGVAMELQLQFEKEKVKVLTENAIRKALSPTKLTVGEPIYLQRKEGEAIVGNVMLPSGFFGIKEMRNEAGELTGIALYGGGSGHGVGMSQYGAKKLAEEGKTAREIIAHYFPGTAVEKVY